MNLRFLPGWSPFPLVRSLLNSTWRVALGCSLLAVLLLAALAYQGHSDPPLNLEGWTLADFLAHLQQRGVHLHTVWGAKDKVLGEHAFLTEDPDAAWLSLQSTPRLVERIGRWQGMVWVGEPLPGEDVGELLTAWGRYGGRIGPFLLFGDETILRRIREVCR